MILFETGTSVWELMWEVALVYFIFRISFVYFILAFTSCETLIYFYNSASVARHLPVVLQSPLVILIILLISRYIIYYYDVPRVLGFRLAIGLVASILLALSYTWSNTLSSAKKCSHLFGNTGGAITENEVIALIIFMLMPAFWMLHKNASDSPEGDVKNLYKGQK